MDNVLIAQIEEELKFNSENLTWEFERHAEVTFRYNMRLNQVRAELRKLESIYKRKEAEKVLDLRKFLKIKGEKWTVDQIRAKTLLDLVGMEESIESKKQQVEFWTKVCDSFAIKGDMIRSYGALKRSEMSFLD